MEYENTYKALANFGRELLEKKTLAGGLPLIATYAKNVIGAERCSIFIYDFEDKELWTTLADGVQKIVVPSKKGLVGKTLQERKPQLSNDPYSDADFLADVDIHTGFKTKNIITAPIFDSKRQILGVLELLNKEEDFDNEDVKFMIFFAHYVSGFLELAHVYLKEDKQAIKGD